MTRRNKRPAAVVIDNDPVERSRFVEALKAACTAEREHFPDEEMPEIIPCDFLEEVGRFVESQSFQVMRISTDSKTSQAVVRRFGKTIPVVIHTRHTPRSVTMKLPGFPVRQIFTKDAMGSVSTAWISNMIAL